MPGLAAAIKKQVALFQFLGAKALKYQILRLNSAKNEIRRIMA
jgi:hypothetical protein